MALSSMAHEHRETYWSTRIPSESHWKAVKKGPQQQCNVVARSAVHVVYANCDVASQYHQREAPSTSIACPWGEHKLRGRVGVLMSYVIEALRRAWVEVECKSTECRPVVQRERKRPTNPTGTVNTIQHFVTSTSTVPKYICSLLWWVYITCIK